MTVVGCNTCFIPMVRLCHSYIGSANTFPDTASCLLLLYPPEALHIRLFFMPLVKRCSGITLITTNIFQTLNRTFLN